MAKKLSLSNSQLELDDIQKVYVYRIKALNLFFSTENHNFVNDFFGLEEKEINEELNYQLLEVDIDSCLNILASIEAKFRIDYDIRVKEESYDSNLSNQFKVLFQSKEYNIRLDEEIIKTWKLEYPDFSDLLSNIKGAFNYRHWLAHGRYWIPKLGRKYDYSYLYQLALELEKLPFKQNNS